MFQRSLCLFCCACCCARLGSYAKQGSCYCYNEVVFKNLKCGAVEAKSKGTKVKVLSVAFGMRVTGGHNLSPWTRRFISFIHRIASPIKPAGAWTGRLLIVAAWLQVASR